MFRSLSIETIASLILSLGKDVNLMPNIDVNSPVSSAPTDRLTLSVGWVRPGAAGIVPSSPATYCCSGCAQCFEGSDE